MAETDIIPHEMENTRQALADKLETLERKVTNTVESVTDTVKETVESVTDKFQTAVDSVSGTVEAVTQTVDSAKEAVQGTMDSVKQGLFSAKDTVENTVQSVKDSVSEVFDLPGHVRSHPWAMLGGSVLLGFLGGKLLGGGGSSVSSSSFAKALGSYDDARDYARDNSRRSFSDGRSEGRSEGRSSNGLSSQGNESSSSKPGWMDWVTTSFGSELNTLKGLAVGTTVGVVRDMVVQSLPEHLKHEVSKLMNDFTSSLGGKPIQEPVMDEEIESTQSRRF